MATVDLLSELLSYYMESGESKILDHLSHSVAFVVNEVFCVLLKWQRNEDLWDSIGGLVFLCYAVVDAVHCFHLNFLTRKLIEQGLVTRVKVNELVDLCISTLTFRAAGVRCLRLFHVILRTSSDQTPAQNVQKLLVGLLLDRNGAEVLLKIAALPVDVVQTLFVSQVGSGGFFLCKTA